MSKQLTLFGKRASAGKYFKDPKNDYERFVNEKWEENFKKYGRKQDFLHAFFKELDDIKDNAGAGKTYLKTCPAPAKILRSSFVYRTIITKSFTTSATNPLTTKPATTTPSPPLSSTFTFEPPSDRVESVVPNFPSKLSCRDQYLKSQEYELTRQK